MKLEDTTPRHSRRRKGLAIAAATGLVLGGVAFAQSALAVHDEGFSLEADVDGDPIDWVDLFDTTQQPPVPLETLPGDFGAAAFKDDYFLPDASGYATGTKDTLPISGSQGWQCKTPNNLGAKFDIVNAYAGALSPSSGDTEGDLIIYFGAEISAPEGNSNVGVWLLKDGDVACSGQGNTDFAGQHRDGDVFIVSAFTGGGVNSNIDVYEWVDPDPTNGTDTDGSLQLAGGFPNAQCPPQSQDLACAIANTNGDKTEDESLWVETPWESPTKDGSGILKEAQFFEGGVNLSELGLEGCFSTFLANSRSSQSTTATLHDFAVGSFNVCNASLVTTPSESEPLDLGDNLYDTATITATGLANTPPPSGSVDFYVCGPEDGLSSCDADSGTLFDSVNLSGATVSGNEYSVDSTTYTPAAAGDYCFYAEWAGDSNYDGGPYSDGSSGECFTVNPNEPSITTSQTGAGGLPLGSPISDTATLLGTAAQPNGDPANGTITFYAYGPQTGNLGDEGYTADCTGDPAYTSAAYTVSGDGTYPTDSQADAEFTPTEVGTYEWVAVYSGDLPNTLGAESMCGDEPSVLFKLQPTMDTEQFYYPQDKATVNVATGAGDLTGSVTFEAFENDQCTGTPEYSETVNKSGNTGQTLMANTDNTSYKVDGASTTVWWKVSFVSSNSGVKNVTSDCTETSTVTIDNGSTANTP